jgi:tRNA(fMet)-specific endonuclease VapC
MIRYLLDTGTCIGYLNGSLPKVAARLRRHRPGEIALSALTLSELMQGARQSKRVAENLRLVQDFVAPLAVLPFDAPAAEAAARIRAELQSEIRGWSPWDLLLAASALERSLTLVTAEVRSFSRVPGLVVEDWSA